MTSYAHTTLPGDTAATVPALRHWVTAALAGLPGPVVDNARLAASELATNALRYSRSGLPGGLLTGRVEIGVDVVVIEVIDQGSDDEKPQVIDDFETTDEGGRGLFLCAACGELTSETTSDGGRRVAVRIPVTTIQKQAAEGGDS